MPKEEVIDTHVHLGLSKDGEEITLKEIKELLNQYPIRSLLLFPIDELDHGTSYQKSNSKVLKAAEGDKRIYPVFRIDPHEPEAAFREIQRAAKVGARAIKLHPRSEDFSPHQAEEIIAEIERLRLPVILHTAHDRHSHPSSWERIFLRHKKICFILAHAGKDAFREAGEVSERLGNVFLETSTLSYSRTQELLKRVGADKMVFGSDPPYSHPAIEILKFDLILGKKSPARRKIFRENAKRIFEI
ncbi:MAG: TatD family hydrolase [Candidatus Omnitrophota bacterium]|nr:TatD family hydrolase [Candidatus Omnitrophota bacterium]